MCVCVCVCMACAYYVTDPFCTYLDANHDPPEIHRLVPNYGSSSGGETIAIIGTRMHSRELITTRHIVCVSELLSDRLHILAAYK